MEALASELADIAAGLPGLFLSPGSRVFVPYLLSAVLVGFLAYHLYRKHLAPEYQRSFLAYLFNRKVLLNTSTLVDVKVIVFNRLLSPLVAAAAFAPRVASAQFVASLLVGTAALTAVETTPTIQHSLPVLLFVTLAVTLATDFTTYWVHRLHHETAIFWPFHKLHHSAESLTPLTVLRKHPMYDIFRGLSNGLLLGPVQGVIFAMFGLTDFVTILGVSLIYAAFNWGGSNLRHSHLWFSYGPFWSKIFISPAQHQIHHSCAVQHHDKNYGEVFALWDWAFGTLFIPDGYEQLTFGVADSVGTRQPQPHPTLKDAMLVPFIESGKAFAATNDDGVTHKPSSAS